jgi:predicted TIM-barrel fold metal-dependent hydrolase
MKQFARTLAVALLGAAAALTLVLLRAQSAARAAQPVPAISPFVDAHAHPDPSDPERSVRAALEAMKLENAAKIVLMPQPFTFEDRERYDAEVLLPAIKGHTDKLAVLGGGGTLNPMIQQSARSGDAGAEIQRKFKEQAEELLRLGAVGFGELTAEHFPSKTPYQSVAPDHPLFLLLADIAAEHGVPIDLHMEAVPQAMPLPAPLESPPNPPRLRANIAAFERLLAHNPRARIIWAHAGADNTGYRTPELCRRLLAAHPNLYMDVKIDPLKPGKNPLLANGASGAIKPEWLALFEDFPDRFVVGTDQSYPEPPGPQRWEAMVLLLNQLPAGLRGKIGVENAARLYPAGAVGKQSSSTLEDRLFESPRSPRSP